MGVCMNKVKGVMYLLLGVMPFVVLFHLTVGIVAAIKTILIVGSILTLATIISVSTVFCYEKGVELLSK
jgi:hypothetical protein